MTNLKYYDYVSKAKIEMLYNQIPLSIREKLEANIKINLHLAEVSFTQKQFSDNIYAKLNLVIQCLEKTGSIGTLSKPLHYFKGSMYLGMAQIFPGVIFWGGTYNDISVGLGGSMNHLLGYQLNTADVAIGISHTPWLVSLLSKEIEMIVPFDSSGGQFYGGSVMSMGKKEYEERVKTATVSWAYDLTTKNQYQVAKVEFVARKLRTYTFGGHPVVLGTPIYIARAD